jgi:hypothetical protein
MGHGMRGRTRVPSNLKHGLSHTPRYRKDIWLRAKYGITVEDFERMSAEQGRRCAICSEVKKLYVDHNHVTGEVRGLLCNRCNIRLAALDDPEWMSRAVAYHN